MGTTHSDGATAEPHQEVTLVISSYLLYLMYLPYLLYLHIYNVQVATNLVTLQTCLTSMMGRPITMDQLRQDVGTMVEKITKVITTFRNFRLTMQEYVCLKVVAMLTTQEGAESGSNVDSIDRK